MVNFDEHPPYHPDPGNVKNMDVDHESSSPVLNSQEAVLGAKTGAFPEHAEYITVNRSRDPNSVRFPTHYFGGKSADLPYMRNWVMTTLAEVAPVKQGSFTIAKVLVSSTNIDAPKHSNGDENPELKLVEFLIFNVSSKEDVTTACQHGGRKDDSVILFEAHPYTAQPAQTGRTVKIVSLAWNTTASDIKAAVKEWGEVESVTTSFNSRMTMKEALVIFKSEESVKKLKESGTTCIIVQDDVGTIAQLGSMPVTYDPSYTVKLAYLPRHFTPADLKRSFDEHIKGPNAVSSYHTLTMPLVLGTTRRYPEAFVRFASREQQVRAVKSKLLLDGQEALWVPAKQHTCHHCGHPEHFQRDCISLQRIIAREKTRRANAAIIRGASTPRSSPRTPLTQAPQPAVTLPSASKQTAPPRHSTLPTSGKSYAAIATPSPKNRGSAASNPITIHSTASPATTRSQITPGDAMTIPSNAYNTNIPSDWTQYFREQLNRLEQRQQHELASVRTEVASLNTKFDLILEELRQSRAGNYSAAAPQNVDIVNQDVDLPEAPALEIMVPDSLPSTPSPIAPSPFQCEEPATTQDHHAASSKGSAQYSHLTRRTHITGGQASAKSSTEREDSEHSRKLPSVYDRNGKAPQRNTVSDITSAPAVTPSQLWKMLQESRALNDELMSTIRELKREQTERESVYQALFARLNQQDPSRGATPAASAHTVQSPVHSNDLDAYGQAPYIGSTESTTRPDPNAALDSVLTPDSDADL